MRKWFMKENDLLESIRSENPSPNEIAAWYIGQVGYIFKSTVCTIAIDPVLNDLTGPDGLTRRYYQPPFQAEALCVDYVLCTHGHDDHMALPTLTAVAQTHPETQFLVPGGCVEKLSRAGVDPSRIIPMKSGNIIELPGLTVRPIQAAHPVHEVDAQERDLAVCLSLRLGQVELLHLGDTYLTDQLLCDLKKQPRADAAFMPINGGDYFRTARNCIGNLSAIESATLAVELGVRIAVPTHFDMMQGNTTDPFEFVKLLWERDPSAAFRIPALGERITFRAFPG